MRPGFDPFSHDLQLVPAVHHPLLGTRAFRCVDIPEAERLVGGVCVAGAAEVADQFAVAEDDLVAVEVDGCVVASETDQSAHESVGGLGFDHGAT